MAALFYLPRLYVYHSTKETKSDASETFKIMEKRLLSLIANPSAVVVWVTGLTLISYKVLETWLILKIALVLGMTIFHLYLWYILKVFSLDKNTKSERAFRVLNEIPTILLLVIIYLVVFQPK
jgi:putative membrane protein